MERNCQECRHHRQETKVTDAREGFDTVIELDEAVLLVCMHPSSAHHSKTVSKEAAGCPQFEAPAKADLSALDAWTERMMASRKKRGSDEE